MSKTNKIIGLIVLVIIVVVVVVTGMNRPPKQLTFGLISGMTGAYAAVGQSFTQGADLAQEEWNNSHPNEQIKMILEDDGFDAKKGVSAYEKLTSIDHIDGLINCTTATIDAIYNDVTKSGIPVALGFEQSIQAKDDNIVQLWPGTVPAEVKLGQYIKDQGFKNVVVFVDNGSAAFQRFADGFTQGYMLPVTEIKVATDGTDIKTNALKVVSLKPDAIVFIVTPANGALLVKEIKTLSSAKYQFVFDADIQTGFSDYTKILGDTNILNGSILYTVPETYRTDFAANFKKKYGTDPAIGSETGYNAFMLLAQSYDSNKTTWVSNMTHASFVGADGQITFDANGVRIPELKIGTIASGKLPN